jgi:hypothetical protein
MTPSVAFLPAARSRLSAFLTAGTCLLLLIVGANAAGAAGFAPHRTNGRGAWFARTCGAAPPGRVSCSDEVVVDAGGHALSSDAPRGGAYGPAEFHAAYSLPTTAPTPATIAIVDAFDHPRIESDLAAYSAYYGLPDCTSANGCFRKVDEFGGSSYPEQDAGWSLEIALDVEVAHAVCQSCRILLVEAAAPTMGSLGGAVNEAVGLGADVVSISWGGHELRAETRYDELYFHHPGVPIAVASGDSGYGADYPAASPYVTAVGGTTLVLAPGGGYGGEIVWPHSGSGCSMYEPKPAWQHDDGCAHRTVADVSADADPNTGAAVYDSVRYSGETGWFRIGGTSLSAPLVAGVYALAGSTRGATFASTPYSRADRLHDIVTGSNGDCSPFQLCTAGTGFDGPSGLGTPAGVGAFSSETPPLPDFSLSAGESRQIAAQGREATYAVTLSPADGFVHDVDLTVSGLPRGATAAFSPAVLGAGARSSTLTVTTLGATRPGRYALTVTGTDASNAGLHRATRLSLGVQRATPVSRGV